MEKQRVVAKKAAIPVSAVKIKEKIRQLHDEAFLYIEQGLSCDEKNLSAQAVNLYKKGLTVIDQALDMISNIGKMEEHEWKETNGLIKKMKKSKAQVESRLNSIVGCGSSNQHHASPSPADLLTDNTTNSEHDMDTNNYNAKELFKIQDGVQVFFINENGAVSAPSYPSDLKIFKFTKTECAENAPAFLKVGNWTYPLHPGVSPALHAFWGAYLFPDITSPGASIGVIIPDTISSTDTKKFEQLLTDLAQLKAQDESSMEGFTFPEIPADEPVNYDAQNLENENEARMSSKVAKGIQTAADWVSWGVTKGAEQTGILLKKGSTLIKEKVNPSETPATVDPRAQQGIYYARQATGAAVKVSSFLVQKLGEGTVALAKMTAPHLRQQGEKLLPKSVTKQNDNGYSKLDDVAVVAMGGLQGWATVYTGLETAAKALAVSLTNETVQVMTHRYGKDAGNLTENGMFAAGNIGMAAYNFNHLGVKAVAKRAAKDAGKAVVEDYGTKNKTPVSSNIEEVSSSETKIVKQKSKSEQRSDSQSTSKDFIKEAG